MIKPYFSMLTKVLPVLEECVVNNESNIEYWKTKIPEYEEKL